MLGFTNAHGFTAADVMLPERFFAEPGSSGAGIVPPLDRQRFAEELRKYCRIRTLASDGTFTAPDFLSSLK